VVPVRNIEASKHIKVLSAA